MNKFGVLGRLALFTTTLIWGTSFVVLKNTLDSISVMWVLAIRFVIASVLLLLFASKKLKNMDRKSFWGSVLIGVCLALAYIVQTYGLKYTTPGKNSFLTSVYCILVPFFAWGFFHRKPGVHNVLGAVICVAGIGFVALDSGFGNINIGDALTLACGIFYALQIILMEQYISGCDSLSVSAVEFSTSAVICLVGALLFEPAPTYIPSNQILSLLYMGAMCTALCFFLQAWGMKYVPSSTAAMIMTLEAVFGTVFSVIVYHEQVTSRLFIGFVLIFFAVVISETGGELLRKLKKQ
ncbi:MAG: DMT family transporter [Eubacteriales bacterium]|nr:DMT family transporter [Eubacteriales bacterium]